jgi:hypothetical protein
MNKSINLALKNISNLIVIFFIPALVFAQQDVFPKWGIFSKRELDMKVYEKDSTANAVVLKEVINVYVQNYGDYKIEKEVYIRIKILSKEGFKYATIEIPTYKEESIKEIRASTSNYKNGRRLTILKNKNIFKNKTSEDWSLTSFTFPDIQIGSIIEYKYILTTPYHHTFGDGWIFQNEIPKISSSYHAKIPAFWQYHITTIGLLGVEPKEYKIVDNCMQVGESTANCLYIVYDINNIPAFVEEDYATSKYNFLKQVKFELKTFINSNKDQTQITKTWETVDKGLFKDYLFGKKYNKTQFIEKRLPLEIFNETNKLIKAKKVYSFIQKHFNWNQKLELFKDFNYKKDFESKVGNMVSINLNLVNALLAVEIPVDFALLSTRQNGNVGKLHPTLSDFNYLVAHVKIDGEDYFLDATNKNLPFGTLPFKCLNNGIRVFDKKKGSYWHYYVPKEKNTTIVYSIAKVAEDASSINMQTRVIYKGYDAYDKREDINELGISEYKEKIEEKNEDWEIDKQTISNLKEIDKSLIETYQFKYDIISSTGGTFYIKPFVIKSFTSNPFKLKQRLYPIDLGYTKKFKYNLSFIIPDGFEIKSVPESKNIILENKGGSLVYLTDVKNKKITINLIFSLDKIIYFQKEYSSIKDFVALLIKLQEERIILTKK